MSAKKPPRGAHPPASPSSLSKSSNQSHNSPILTTDKGELTVLTGTSNDRDIADQDANQEVNRTSNCGEVNNQIKDEFNRLLSLSQSSIQAGVPKNTQNAIRSDISTFETWCETVNQTSFPCSVETILAYIEHRAEQGKKIATIKRELSSIATMHKLAGFDPPPTQAKVVHKLLRAKTNLLGGAQRQVEPLTEEMVMKIFDVIPHDTAGARDRALIAIGFACALRRGEIVALTTEDIRDDDRGLIVTIRKSKTDQAGVGRDVGILFATDQTYCPIRALKSWLKEASITSGAIFRKVDQHGNIGANALRGKAVARIVKRAVKAIGKDPANYSGHSLRVGLATSAAAAGKSERIIADQTGHKSRRQLRKYIRMGSLFRDNATEGLFRKPTNVEG